MKNWQFVRILSIGFVLVVVAALVVIGGITAVQYCNKRFFQKVIRKPGYVQGKTGQLIPISKLPGPPRNWSVPKFILDDENSQQMIGMDDPVNERWCDMAGNFYSGKFISGFSYERPGRRGPVVLIRIQPEAATFAGRLEARGLKPNFAYQLKLRGVFSDRKSFETIGFLGRWRLPGKDTNYSDKDYLNYTEKEKVEAYIYFDFFVTDYNGNALREFALDSSLHITWNASRQCGDAQIRDLVPAIVRAHNPAFYARPKQHATVELLWAERERIRYSSANEVIRLPPGSYRAELVLTEESFHSYYNDGGYWGTVYVCPVTFTIISTPEPEKSP